MMMYLLQINDLSVRRQTLSDRSFGSMWLAEVSLQGAMYIHLLEEFAERSSISDS